MKKREHSEWVKGGVRNEKEGGNPKSGKEKLEVQKQKTTVTWEEIKQLVN